MRLIFIYSINYNMIYRNRPNNAIVPQREKSFIKKWKIFFSKWKKNYEYFIYSISNMKNIPIYKFIHFYKKVALFPM